MAPEKRCGAQLTYDHSGTKVTYVCDRARGHKDGHGCGAAMFWTKGATMLSDVPTILTSYGK